MLKLTFGGYVAIQPMEHFFNPFDNQFYPKLVWLLQSGPHGGGWLVVGVGVLMLAGWFFDFSVLRGLNLRSGKAASLLVLAGIWSLGRKRGRPDSLSEVVRTAPVGLASARAIRGAGNRIVDFEWTVVNEIASRLGGPNFDKPVGKRPFGTPSGLLPDDWFGPCVRTVETGEPFRLEHHYALPDRWLEVSATKLGDGFVVAFVDVTERRRTAEKLEESERFIERIADLTPDALFIHDLPSRQTYYVNREATREAYALNEIPRILHPDDADRCAQHLRDFVTAADGEIRELEYRLRDKQGQWHWMLARNAVFKRTSEGVPHQIIGVIRDTTENKTTEQLLAGVLDSSLEGIVVFAAVRDEAGLITDFSYELINQSTERLLGRKREELVGKRLLVEFPGTEKALFNHYAAAVESGKPLSHEFLYQHEGFQNWFCIEAVKYEDGLVATFADITERKNNELELHRKNLALQHAYQALATAQQELTTVNAQLEKRVEKRTRELLATEEELRQTLDQSIELNEKLRESENFLSSLVDQSPISTWIADAEGTQIRVNAACLKLFGVEDANLGLGKYNLFRDELLRQAPFFEDIRSVFTAGKATRFSVEYDLSKVNHVNIPSGIPVTLVTTIFPIKNDEGVVTNAVIQHEDVTQQRRAQEALQAGEERYRAFVQQSSEAIWRFELDAAPIDIRLPEDEQIALFYQNAYLAECNDTMARMYGFSSAG
ncbi:MAG: PAS domain S-box protein, partial [Ferruginibacter sp.]|nr:PAS domain S-box protein [Cytophagales bacterium]